MHTLLAYMKELDHSQSCKYQEKKTRIPLGREGANSGESNRTVSSFLLPSLFFFPKKFRTILYAGNFNNSISTGGGNRKPLQYSCLESPISSVKRQKDMTPEDEPPRLEGVQYATGEEWRDITNSSRKNEEAWLKRKWCPVVDVSGNESKVQCCKEQCCIQLGLLGPWVKINWMWSSRRWPD